MQGKQRSYQDPRGTASPIVGVYIYIYRVSVDGGSR